MQLLGHREKKMFMLINKIEIGQEWKNKFLTYVTFLGLVFAKNIRLEIIKISEPKVQVNLSQDGYFSVER